MSDRSLRMLHWLLKNEQLRCENSTFRIGSCYDDGRIPGAQFMADACCNACMIHRFLVQDKLPEEEPNYDGYYVRKIEDHVNQG